MSYALKEVYYTLQGEGAHTGRAAVFARFSGCNLWTGREADRKTAACSFCDTNFVGTDGPGGGKFASAQELASHIYSFWPASQPGRPYVVCTGGEPALQLDQALVEALHRFDFEVGIETNGTLALPPGLDWICVSPKPGKPTLVRRGHELKLVYPQNSAALHPEQFADWDFHYKFLQPLDDEPRRAVNTQACVDYCLEHPTWRLSMQTHKYLGIP